MAINIAPTPLTIQHIEFLIDCRNKNHTYHLLSSTKQRLANDLHTRVLVEDDMQDDGKTLIKITINGLNLLQHLTFVSNQWTRTQ